MSAFKIKSNLDIGGNQLLNYCVGSYDDLENVNKGVGRKLFYTGSETEKNLRELIYDGTRWKTAAYLEDLTTFKDEDFNALKEKVDTLIGDGVDMDGIIESWKEVEAFLAGMSDTKTLMTMLDDKLSKSEGGTITGAITISLGGSGLEDGLILNDVRGGLGERLRIKWTSTDYAGVSLYPSNDYTQLTFYDGSTGNTIIHSGNFNTYAPTLTGKGASGTWGIDITGTSAKATADALGNVIASTYATKEQLNAKNSFDQLFASAIHTDVINAEAMYAGSFDGGVVNVTGASSFANNRITLTSGSISSKVAYLGITGGANYIWGYGDGNYLCLGAGGTTLNKASSSLVVEKNAIYSGTNNAVSLGTSPCKWSSVHSVLGNFSQRVLIGGADDDGASALQVKGKGDFSSTLKVGASAYIGDELHLNLASYSTRGEGSFLLRLYNGELQFSSRLSGGGLKAYPLLIDYETSATTLNGLATFNAGAYIPTGQTMRFGSGGPTMEYDANANAIKVTGNIYATGTVASGGKAQDGTSSGGNAQVYKYTLSAGTNSYEVQNVKSDVNVIVQVYEWNSNSSSWDMILTDVSVKESGITVTFGRNTEVDHMVTVC